MSELEKWNRRHMEFAHIEAFLLWLRNEKGIHFLHPTGTPQEQVAYIYEYLGIDYERLLKERRDALHEGDAHV